MALRSGVLARVRKSGKGQTMTEYSLIVLFVGLAAYTAYTGLGLGVKAFTNNVTAFISAAVAAL
jgi:Flp pilus assembly pilin Flp